MSTEEAPRSKGILPWRGSPDEGTFDAMTQTGNGRPGPGWVGAGAVLGGPRADEEAAFAALAERHRRELHVHCYRMLGSFEEAEDLVQETLLRAWRGRTGFEERSTFRAWLYRIATNACLDFLRLNPRRVPPSSQVPWLQPYPDRLLDEVASSEAGPDAVVVAKETIELAFLAAIQLLPPRQRAVLLLRDVLGWSARETAWLLDSGVPAVNSALQRARATLRKRRPAGRHAWAPSADEHALLRRYVDAVERADVAGFVELLREDARLTMPAVLSGRDALAALFTQAFGPDARGRCRCVPTGANRQPAVACYVRRSGDAEYRALTLDVLRFEEGALAEISVFGPGLFPAFGLPPSW
jgi:RNA polymerase sigma-70 factor (ECF subfamily)